MSPVSEQVIRDHTERVLAILHLIDGQVEDGAPINERARQNLHLANDILERITGREEARRVHAA